MKTPKEIIQVMMLIAALFVFGSTDFKTTEIKPSQDSTLQAVTATSVPGDSLAINPNHDPTSFDEEKTSENEQKDKPRKRNRGLLAIGVLLIVVALILWIK